MSTEKHQIEAERWISQGEEDLDAARVLLEGQKFAQACFYAQHSAEKAMKGVAWRNGLDLWGHSLLKLRDGLMRNDVDVEDLASEDLRLLDKFYIPTRYPNGLPEIIPQEGYGRDQAEKGIDAAKRIIDWCRG